MVGSVYRERTASLTFYYPIVQRVYAVGEPPKDKICFFRGLKNVVVLPAIGA